MRFYIGKLELSEAGVRDIAMNMLDNSNEWKKVELADVPDFIAKDKILSEYDTIYYATDQFDSDMYKIFNLAVLRKESRRMYRL